MNKVTALRETIRLWNLMACNPGVRKDEIPGPWCGYVSECPCCEYAGTGVERKVYCRVCPMLEQWTCFDKSRNVASYLGPNPCCSEYSPYWRWVQEMDLLEGERCRLEAEGGTDEESARCIPDYNSRPSKYDIEFFCLLIAELAEEALNELPESERNMVA